MRFRDICDASLSVGEQESSKSARPDLDVWIRPGPIVPNRGSNRMQRAAAVGCRLWCSPVPVSRSALKVFWRYPSVFCAVSGGLEAFRLVFRVIWRCSGWFWPNVPVPSRVDKIDIEI